MYYALKRSLIWLLLVISIIYAIPVTVMIGINIWPSVNGIINTIPKISTANFFDVQTPPNWFVLGDVSVYLNCAAIGYLLFHSIYLRRMLIKMNDEIDEEEVTASDFAVLARGLPHNIT